MYVYAPYSVDVVSYDGIDVISIKGSDVVHVVPDERVACLLAISNLLGAVSTKGANVRCTNGGVCIHSSPIACIRSQKYWNENLGKDIDSKRTQISLHITEKNENWT